MGLHRKPRLRSPISTTNSDAKSVSHPYSRRLAALSAPPQKAPPTTSTGPATGQRQTPCIAQGSKTERVSQIHGQHRPAIPGPSPNRAFNLRKRRSSALQRKDRYGFSAFLLFLRCSPTAPHVAPHTFFAGTVLWDSLGSVATRSPATSVGITASPANPSVLPPSPCLRACCTSAS